MKQWVRVRPDGTILRPCWVPEGATVRVDYWIPPFSPGLPRRDPCQWAHLEYRFSPHIILSGDGPRIEELARKLNELVAQQEEGYFLALTAAYRAIGPCWQVDFIPDMLRR